MALSAPGATPLAWRIEPSLAARSMAVTTRSNAGVLAFASVTYSAIGYSVAPMLKAA